jgi:hypothetical protein
LFSSMLNALCYTRRLTRMPTRQRISTSNYSRCYGAHYTPFRPYQCFEKS